MWKKIKRILSYTMVLLIAIAIGATAALFIYKDQILNEVIQAANNNINTPIHVEKIDLNYYEKFPQIAISFSNVIVEESWPESTDPLLLADKMFFTLSPIQLLKGDYVINQVHIEDAELFLRLDGKGRNNYNIISKGENANDSLTVNLNRILLKNVDVNFVDDLNQQQHSYYIQNHDAQLTIMSDKYLIKTQGDLRTNFIKVRGKNYAVNRDLHIDTDLVYYNEQKELEILPSTINLNTSGFNVTGSVNTLASTKIDLSIEGIDSNIQTLLSFLPGEYSDNLRKYQSEGEVYFNAELKGETSGKVNTRIDFGLKNATITHPEFQSTARNISLSGEYRSSSFVELSKGDLSLKGISGTLGNLPFKAEIVLNNLANPDSDIEIDGEFALEELIKFFPQQKFLTSATGTVTAQVSLAGQINDLKSRYSESDVQAAGEIRLDNVRLSFEQNYPPPMTIDGDFIFNQNDLAANNTSFDIGSSKLLMQGFFRNVLPFLLFDKQPIGIEADINAEIIDVNELLATDSHEDYRFDISPYLILDFNCNVDRLIYKRFDGRNIKGDLKVKKKIAVANDISFEAMGGNLQFSGTVDSREEVIKVTTQSTWQNLEIDSLFYVFKNFNQNWLVQEHLKGSANAKVTANMSFEKTLDIIKDQIVADIGITIKNGELNDFEPLMALDKYVDDPNLSRLKFSELENEIHVENEKVYLPQMEVRSNVTNILIAGTHTFDQRIDYRTVVPIKSLGRARNEELFGAVEDDGSGPKLHLKITGTTDDYEITLDAQGVKTKILADIKKEAQELKEAFKKKKSDVSEEVELNEEEFFEWEEDTIYYKRKYPLLNGSI